MTAKARILLTAWLLGCALTALAQAPQAPIGSVGDAVSLRGYQIVPSIIPQSGYTLVFNGAKWQPGTVGTSQAVASHFGQWRLNGQAALIAGTNTAVPFGPCTSAADGLTFNELTDGTPVAIIDTANSVNDEYNVAVSSVVITPTGCTATLLTGNPHPSTYYITTATGGAQEAINADTGDLPNTVVLDSEFYALGGTAATPYSRAGNANLPLVDVTTAPYSVYTWGADAGEYATVNAPNVNGTSTCYLSGAGATPPVTCSAATATWQYSNTTATGSPNHVQLCENNGGTFAWTGIY